MAGQNLNHTQYNSIYVITDQMGHWPSHLSVCFNSQAHNIHLIAIVDADWFKAAPIVLHSTQYHAY